MLYTEKEVKRLTEQLPEWADEAKLATGAAFFNTHWPNIVTLLFCASLPSAAPLVLLAPEAAKKNNNVTSRQVRG